MPHPARIVCFGAGSFSFGLTTLVSFMRSTTLKGGELALQVLLLDPVIRDMDIANQIMLEYLTAYNQYLPSFQA